MCIGGGRGDRHTAIAVHTEEGECALGLRLCQDQDMVKERDPQTVGGDLPSPLPFPPGDCSLPSLLYPVPPPYLGSGGVQCEQGFEMHVECEEDGADRHIVVLPQLGHELRAGVRGGSRGGRTGGGELHCGIQKNGAGS